VEKGGLLGKGFDWEGWKGSLGKRWESEIGLGEGLTGGEVCGSGEGRVVRGRRVEGMG
jgi:hypothetical protein